MKYVVEVLGPIPSGYEPDDGSEEGVQVPARNRNDHANTLLQSTHAQDSQAPYVIARLKQQFPGMSREKGRRLVTRQKRGDEIASQGKPKTPCNFWSV